MCSSAPSPPSSSPSCSESFGNKVESTIAGAFSRLGFFLGAAPRKTLALAILLTVVCGVGFVTWETESRGEELWVPQNTQAEKETINYEQYFGSTTRFNTMIVQASVKEENVLIKERLVEAMQMHQEIETNQAVVDGVTYALTDLCAKGGGSCVSGPSAGGICQCLVSSILRQWNYNLETLQNDTDFMQTLNQYGSMEDLQAVLGNPIFDDAGEVVSAEAFTLSYFLTDRSEVVDGTEDDPINEGWEKDVFLAAAQSEHTNIAVDYFSARSFEDEFGDAISGDLLLVQVSYVVAFLFLGATLGKIRCGTGSRWSMSLAALVTVGLSTAAGFGLSSAFGLFFGPVHSLLPFILLGIGVDDAFVIVNAFNRERKTIRTAESNTDLAKRAGRALARAGASITVTSLTDMVAFGISSSSALPALASFCAYAAICIFFLYFFASTFFSAAMVLDERRQRDNRRECLCCVTRGKPLEEHEETDVFQEDFISRYFRNCHAPTILSKTGKTVILLLFTGLVAFGFYGALNLPVEDSERAFVPENSYLNGYLDAADKYFPSQGIDVYFIFEGGSDIYAFRQALAELNTRLSGLSEKSPYIAEPVSEEAYRNVMAGFGDYLNVTGSTEEIGNIALGEDNWPTNEADFVNALSMYASITGPGAVYAPDVSFSQNGTQLEAIRVQSEYVRLTKLTRGEIIDDADRQIEAMDDTRAMVASWDDLPTAFPYSSKFLTIEGFKIIRRELFMNVGLAIAAVGVIVFCTVASPMTAFLILLSVAFCIIEILGFMWALGIVIDSVSVINIVLAVGLSVDYSAHVGHCFMTKGGSDKNKRSLEALADIGAAVLNGAVSTFLAVAVLLFSSSYVFQVLSRQFALTVALGIAHGLILLPVLLSILGPKPFDSAEKLDEGDKAEEAEKFSGDQIAATSHLSAKGEESSDNEEENGDGNNVMKDVAVVEA